MQATDIGAARRQISIINDPFNQNSICKVWVHCYKSDFNGNWSYSGEVEFKNGKTEGKQKFTGKDMGEVLIKIEAFIKELEE